MTTSSKWKLAQTSEARCTPGLDLIRYQNYGQVTTFMSDVAALITYVMINLVLVETCSHLQS